MQRGQCIVPIDLPNGEYAGVRNQNSDSISMKEDWLKDIRSNNEKMTLIDPEYVSPIPNQNNYGTIVSSTSKRTPLVSFIGSNHMVSLDDNVEVQFAYNNQKGKNQANSEAALEGEKKKEKTIVSHAFCERGFARVKRFSDETWDWHIIACGRIEQVKHWLINGTEYVRLLISDTTPGYIVREAEWTDVFEFSELEKNKFVEGLLSRYFKPVDSRVYESAALKDFCSRIQEEIRKTPLEVVRTEAGWFKFGNKRIYYDGTNFPQKENMLSQLRRSSSKVNISVEEILSGICEELAVYDFGKRISFLIGYGLITWFSDVCSINWNKCPGIMLLGKEDVCRRYSDTCLKMYTRVKGSDIVELMDTDKRVLTEYVDVLKDDAFVLNGYDLSGSALKFAKAIISGRSFANHRINAPLVVLQNIPNEEIAYSEYVTIDLNGFRVSEKLCFYMQELKAMLLSVLEAEPFVDSEACIYKTASYEDAIKIVLPAMKKYLLSEGASTTVLDKFFNNLEQGMMVYYHFCGNERDTLVYMAKQRFEQIIATGAVPVIRDTEYGVSHDNIYSLIVKDDAVFIPAKYLKIGIFPRMGIDQGDFNRVRDALIANGLLDIYGDNKGYTRKITIDKTRVHAYKFDKSLFIAFEKRDF